MFASDAAAVADGFMCSHMLEQRAEHYKMNAQKKTTTSECSNGEKREKKTTKREKQQQQQRQKT